MKNLACIALLVMSCVACLASDAFSRLNESLKNDAAIKFYANCFLERGPCSGDARAVKWLLPDLVASSCGKCSTKQKKVACRIVTILQQEKHSEIWNALLKKYDPKVIYRKNLDSFNKMCEIKFKIVIPKEVVEAEKTTEKTTAKTTKEADEKIHKEKKAATTAAPTEANEKIHEEEKA